MIKRIIPLLLYKDGRLVKGIKYDNFINVGYEGRCAGLFPDCAVVFKTPDYIEKFLGDPGEDYNEAILTPKDFYDFFVNMNQLEIANG